MVVVVPKWSESTAQEVKGHDLCYFYSCRPVMCTLHCGLTLGLLSSRFACSTSGFISNTNWLPSVSPCVRLMQRLKISDWIGFWDFAVCLHWWHSFFWTVNEKYMYFRYHYFLCTVIVFILLFSFIAFYFNYFCLWLQCFLSFFYVYFNCHILLDFSLLFQYFYFFTHFL